MATSIQAPLPSFEKARIMCAVAAGRVFVNAQGI